MYECNRATPHRPRNGHHLRDVHLRGSGVLGDCPFPPVPLTEQPGETLLPVQGALKDDSVAGHPAGEQQPGELSVVLTLMPGIPSVDQGAPLYDGRAEAQNHMEGE